MEIAKNRTYGYLRVSTLDQDLEKNKKDILMLAHKKKLTSVIFIKETASGKVSWEKRLIADIINELQNGDSIIVSELSRLGRSMLECMEILSIATKKGINIYSVKGDWQLDGTIQSRILAMAFSMAADIEHELISARTKEALKAIKASGKKLGRPFGSGSSKLDKYKGEIVNLLDNGSKQTFIAKKYGTAPSNLYRWLKKNNIKTSV
jgi:DNA invertase Pin-like site-specific DNA recombinase